MAATARRHYAVLKTLIADPFEFEERDPVAPAAFLCAPRVFWHDPAQLLYDLPAKKTQRTPGSDWLVKVLQPMLVDIVGADVDFEALFDEFETLMALVSADGYFVWAGRFAWRGHSRGGQPPYLKQLSDEIAQSGTNHPLLRAGFFDHNASRAGIALTAVGKHATEMSW